MTRKKENDTNKVTELSLTLLYTNFKSKEIRSIINNYYTENKEHIFNNYTSNSEYKEDHQDSLGTINTNSIIIIVNLFRTLFSLKKNTNGDIYILLDFFLEIIPLVEDMTIIDVILDIKFSKTESRMEEAIYKYFRVLDAMVTRIYHIKERPTDINDSMKNINIKECSNNISIDNYAEKIFYKIYYALRNRVSKEFILKELLFMLLRLLNIDKEIRDMFIRDKLYINFIYLREVSSVYYKYYSKYHNYSNEYKDKHIININYNESNKQTMKINYEELIMYIIDNNAFIAESIILSRKYNSYLFYKYIDKGFKYKSIGRIIPFMFLEYDNNILFKNKAEELIKDGVSIDDIINDINYYNSSINDGDYNDSIKNCKYCINKTNYSMKNKILDACNKFNEKKDSSMLMEVLDGYIRGVDNTMILFLRYSEFICRKKLGEFLSAEKNKEHLYAYIHTFDFKGYDVLQALRIFLSTFILPGESQMIVRILLAFTEKYTNDIRLYSTEEKITEDKIEENSKKQLYADTFNDEEKDSIYILCFSLLVLNTDLHNENNRVKITKKQFIENNKECRLSSSITDSYLEEIYDSIKNKPFAFNTEVIKDKEHYKIYKILSNGVINNPKDHNKDTIIGNINNYYLCNNCIKEIYRLLISKNYIKYIDSIKLIRELKITEGIEWILNKKYKTITEKKYTEETLSEYFDLYSEYLSLYNEKIENISNNNINGNRTINIRDIIVQPMIILKKILTSNLFFSRKKEYDKYFRRYINTVSSLCDDKYRSIIQTIEEIPRENSTYKEIYMSLLEKNCFRIEIEDIIHLEAEDRNRILEKIAEIDRELFIKLVENIDENILDLLLSLENIDYKIVDLIKNKVKENNEGFKAMLKLQKNGIDMYSFIVSCTTDYKDNSDNLLTTNDNTLINVDPQSDGSKSIFSLANSEGTVIKPNNSKITSLTADVENTNIADISQSDNNTVITADNFKDTLVGESAINADIQTNESDTLSVILNGEDNIIEMTSRHLICFEEKYSTFLALESNVLLFFRSSPSFLSNKYCENIFLIKKICPYEWFNDYNRFYYLLYKCDDMSKDGIRYGLWIINLFSISLPFISEIIRNIFDIECNGTNSSLTSLISNEYFKNSILKIFYNRTKKLVAGESLCINECKNTHSLEIVDITVEYLVNRNILSKSSVEFYKAYRNSKKEDDIKEEKEKDINSDSIINPLENNISNDKTTENTTDCFEL